MNCRKNCPKDRPKNCTKNSQKKRQKNHQKSQQKKLSKNQVSENSRFDNCIGFVVGDDSAQLTVKWL